MRYLHPLSQPILPNGGDICILGSTGSIGVAALEVISQIKDRDFRIKSLVCGHNIDLLIQQALVYKPSFVACADLNAYDTLRENLPTSIKIYVGQEGILEVCQRSYHYILSAIVGQAGLLPTVTAAQQGSIVALANKECVVVGGEAFMRKIAEKGAFLFPVDSEHSALYHLKSSNQKVEKYIITASGGPFLNSSPDKMAKITVDQALKHPNWKMGAKISIDSATMANKGLELIEAKVLFNLKNTQIDAVIHPQSIIHAMVQTYDGALKLYASYPDMKIAIGASLNYGALNGYRFIEPINFEYGFSWDFRPIDCDKFACFALAKDAIGTHPLMPAIFNAANEIAVAAFLNQKISFLDISDIIKMTMAAFNFPKEDKKTCNLALETYIDYHKQAEKVAQEYIMQKISTNKATVT